MGERTREHRPIRRKIGERYRDRHTRAKQVREWLMEGDCYCCQKAAFGTERAAPRTNFGSFWCEIRWWKGVAKGIVGSFRTGRSYGDRMDVIQSQVRERLLEKVRG